MIDHKDLCERLQQVSDDDTEHGYDTMRAKSAREAKALIESQAEKIADYIDQYRLDGIKIQSLHIEIDEAKARIAELESELGALIEDSDSMRKSLTQEAVARLTAEDRIVELEAQLEWNGRLLAEFAALKRNDTNAKKGYTAGRWLTLNAPGELLERVDAAVSVNKGERI